MGNPRHPLMLQRELQERLRKEGKLPKPAAAKPAAPPPPPAPAATPLPKAAPKTLTAKDRLEALPDEELQDQAKKLLLDAPDDRDELIAALLKAGVTG